jgi:N-acetylmuramoyl-L-alanine amidase
MSMAQNECKKMWTFWGHRRHKGPMALFLLFLLSILPGGPALAGNIIAVEAMDRGAVIRFDDYVSSARVFGLTQPGRIAVDIVGVQAGKSSANTQVGLMRQGQFNPDTARLVLDLTKSVTVREARFGADGKSLQLFFAPVAATDFWDQLSRLRLDLFPPDMFRKAPPRDRYSVSVDLPAPRSVKGLPQIYGPNDVTLPLIVIDAGHGGHDPGAISPHGGAHEKQVTLSIARKTRDALVATGRVRVALTREDDHFIVLQDRYGIARRLGADLFISIHADSAGNAKARGATVYTLSEVASDREARRLAARENKADIINGVNLGGATGDVSSILIDLTQRETMNVSADFAKMLVFEGTRSLTMRSESHKFASFVVLKAPDTPSVLFETGYLSNELDAEFLTSAAGQSKVASTLSRAIDGHFSRRLAMR